MPVGPDDIKVRVEEAIRSALGSATRDRRWVPSAYHYHVATTARDSGTLVPLSYAVGLRETEADSEGRQRRSTGIMCTTTVGVRWYGRVRSSEPDDVTRALADERDLVAAVLDLAKDNDLAVRLDRVAERTTEGDGTIWSCDIHFEVRHFYPR